MELTLVADKTHLNFSYSQIHRLRTILGLLLLRKISNAKDPDVGSFVVRCSIGSVIPHAQAFDLSAGVPDHVDLNRDLGRTFYGCNY